MIDLAGLGIILPVMPELIFELTGASIGEASAIGGWLLFSYAAMQFLFSPVVGHLSDRLGRRPVLLAAIGGLAVNYALMAIAPSLLWLFVGRLFSGALGATYPVAAASVADVTEPEERVKQFGVLHAMIGLGLILGPLLGGLAAGHGVRAPFWVAACIATATLIAGYFLFPETLSGHDIRQNTDEGTRKIMRFSTSFMSSSGSLFIVFFLVEVSFQALPIIWAFYAINNLGWNATTIGYSMAIYGVFIALAQIVLPRHMEGLFGSKVAGIAALSCVTLAYLGLSFSSNETLIWGLILVMAAGTTIFPILQAVLSRRTERESQGALQGSMSSITAVASIVSPLVMTQLFKAFVGSDPIFGSVSWPGAPFFAAAVLSGLALLIYARFFMSARTTATNHKEHEHG
ncbi:MULTISPECIES: MFS transporter [Sphingopyxis]|uniref:MFS transporter n=1 Tax=Sphingopyxis fribergensis TaxID=1515612 RepID=UPI0011DE481F|nr:MFS transporter [Sphingopyxis fribergensis]